MTYSDPGPLVTAIWDGDLDAVRKMIEADPTIPHQVDDDGMTSLMYAVSSSERTPELVKLLLDSGSDVNAMTNEGYTPLHMLVDVSGPTGTGPIPGQIARMLVDAGAATEVRQHWGWTPLMSAAVEGTFDELKALVDVGGDVNKVFPMHTLPAFLRGRTTLMATISSPEQLRVLLEAGAVPSAIDEHGQTALEYAKQALIESEKEDVGPMEISQEILDQSADELKEMMKEMGVDLDATIGSTGETWRQWAESSSRELEEELDDSEYDYQSKVRKSIEILETALRKT